MENISSDSPGSTGMDPPPAPVDLDLLLHRIARHDEDALALLYGELAARICAVASRTLYDLDQAEDVMQETLIEVWRSAARYDPNKGSAASWVMTIVRRRAVDRVRSEQANRSRERRTAGDGPPYDTVVDTVGHRMEQHQLRISLTALTDLQREAIVLAFYHGHTYAEIAALLRVSLPTVKTRIRDGLARLRACLKTIE